MIALWRRYWLPEVADASNNAMRIAIGPAGVKVFA